MKHKKQKNNFSAPKVKGLNVKNLLTTLHCSKLLVYIDSLLTDQVNLILHHPKFQRLEATWRNLFYLVQQRSTNDNSKVRILNVTWNELSLDLHNAIEFDQSQIFKKIYTNEFDQPGGEPFGLIVCDHYVRLKPRQGETPFNDIQTLFSLSGVAAAAFAPCILGVAPEFFGLDRFADFDNFLDLRKVFKQSDYRAWKNLRKHPDSRFMGLVLPRVSMRHPYRLGDKRNGSFCFKEVCNSTENYLWGNPAYAMAAIVLRSFSQTGWFLNIKGTHQDSLGEGGVVEGLPVHYYDADNSPLYPKPSLEMSLKVYQEKDLSSLGFISLTWCQYTSLCAFYSCQTVYLPDDSYNNKDILRKEDSYYTLYNILSVSRFAHYLKVIGRNKVGSFISALQYQTFLQNWIARYTGQSSGEISHDFIAKYPLAESNVVFSENSNNLGQFFCSLDIRPHVYVKELKGALKLSITLPAIKT